MFNFIVIYHQHPTLLSRLCHRFGVRAVYQCFRMFTGHVLMVEREVILACTLDVVKRGISFLIQIFKVYAIFRTECDSYARRYLNLCTVILMNQVANHLRFFRGNIMARNISKEHDKLVATKSC